MVSAVTTTEATAAEPVGCPAAQFVERFGSRRAAALLTELTGTQIWATDVEELVHAEVLDWTDRFKGHRLVDVAAVHELATRPDFADLLTEHRLLSTSQAAEYLQIRPSDFEYVTAAGWINPFRLRTRIVGRRKQVQFPVFRRSQLDAVKDLPGVDWEAVYATPKGRPSPLREYVRKPPTRAVQIRWFCTQLSHRWKVQVWATWDNTCDTWFVDWDTVDGRPTRDDVAQALADDKIVRQHRRQIVLGSDSGLAVRWARAMLAPGVGCVLDTETTGLDDPRVVEVAVVDAATGEVLLDTLVNPGTPIPAVAQDVHGITDLMVADAPTFDRVWPQLLQATAGRVVLAYNAEFDQGAVLAHARALGLDPGRLAEPTTWGCIMVNYTSWLRVWRWPRLGGGHRALGDTQTARERLLEMTIPHKR
jgi:Exonuclease